MSDMAETKLRDAPSLGEVGEDMHVHKPKAAHGLREFLSEIGIIVVGILIALSAEQVIERVHLNERMRQVHEQLLTETASNARSALYWLTLSPCLDQQIKAADQQVWEARRTGTLQPVHFSPELTQFTSASWLNARSLQVADHLRPEEVKIFTAAYFMADELPPDITRLHEMAAELEPLTRPLDHVSAVEADELIAKIGHAKELTERIELAMALLVHSADQVHAPISPAWERSAEALLLTNARKKSSCIADPAEMLRRVRNWREDVDPLP
jgi:hypothetical protein